MRTKHSVSAIIDENVSIGEGSFIWYFSHVMRGAKIGKRTTIGEKCFIGQNVVIGDDVKIGNNTNIYEGAVIKDRVFIGNNVSFNNVKVPVAHRKAQRYLPTIVDNNVSIGANVTILPGIMIEEGAIIGDGTCVVLPVPRYCLVVGNPGRIIKGNVRETKND